MDDLLQSKTIYSPKFPELSITELEELIAFGESNLFNVIKKLTEHTENKIVTKILKIPLATTNEAVIKEISWLQGRHSYCLELLELPEKAARELAYRNTENH